MHSVVPTARYVLEDGDALCDFSWFLLPAMDEVAVLSLAVVEDICGAGEAGNNVDATKDLVD